RAHTRSLPPPRPQAGCGTTTPTDRRPARGTPSEQRGDDRMSDDHDAREETCPDCQAGPHNMEVRIIAAGEDPETGRMFTTITWHLKDCPAYTVSQILMEDSARRAEERTEWTRKEFPAMQERLLDRSEEHTSELQSRE